MVNQYITCLNYPHVLKYSMKPTKAWISLLLLLIAFPVFPQTLQELSADPGSYIGIQLTELIRIFGTPKAVHAVRGIEQWQDDVVFEYDTGDFYIYKDRVWQIGLKSVYGISLRDSKASALLVFGARAEDLGDHLYCPLPASSRYDGGRPGAWPMALRINFNNSALVSAIYVYRSDF